MNKKELEHLESKALYSFHLTDEMKDIYTHKCMAELLKKLRANIRKKNLAVVLLEVNN